MTIVLNDPTWWPAINASLVASYFIVAASVGVMYDWALTFAQEVELVWRQRWSLMTMLYLSVRYVGIVYAVISIVAQVPTISLTDAGCYILFTTINWITFVSSAMLCVIMIVRLYAMYQRSRKVLIPLVGVFLAISLINGVIGVLATSNTSAEEVILSGSYLCSPSFNGNGVLLVDITWMLSTAWEVLALCLAIWVAVKHFRELQRSSTGRIISDCFTVLIKTHVVYFASFVAVSCFEIGYLSPTLAENPYSLETQIYLGVSQILTFVQMFVLGPRLILGVREFNATLVAESDAGTAMTSVAFQERVHISTGSGW